MTTTFFTADFWRAVDLLEQAEVAYTRNLDMRRAPRASNALDAIRYARTVLDLFQIQHDVDAARAR